MNRVTLYPDGKYRWVYEVSMMKNPSILIDIFKVLGISLGIVWLFTVLLDIFDDDLSLEKLWNLTLVFLGLMLVFVVIGLIAYTILAWSYGWKYVVIFTMDNKELVHQQMPHGRHRRACRLAHHFEVHSCQCQEAHSRSLDEPHQGQPAATEESRLRTR